MRSLTALARGLVLCAVALAGASAAGQDQDLDIETRARIEGYVRLLGADDAVTRDQAERALLEMGAVVRPFLERAKDDRDGEIRQRVQTLLLRLDDADQLRTGADQTWPGLRGGPTRSGSAPGASFPREKPQLVWAAKFWTEKLLQGGVVPANDVVVCLSGEGTLRGFRADDGGRLWLANVGSSVGASAVLAAGRLVVPTGRGLVAMDVATGRTVWEAPAGYGCNAAPAIVGRRVYGAFRNEGVRAFDLTTGEMVFERKLAPSGALLADGDLVVTGTEDGRLLRIDPATGLDIWRVNLGSEPNMGPTLAAPGVIVVFGRDRVLRALSVATGKALWSLRLPATSGSESLAAAAGRVFVTDREGVIRALDAGNGRVLWQRSEGLIAMGGPCASADAVVFGSRGRLICRDADSGDFLWRLDAPRPDNSAPAASGKRLFVHYDGELRCYAVSR